MNRKQRIAKILSKKFDDFLLEIIDNSNLHKGHNNFTGNDETHIKIILTKKDKKPTNRLNIHKFINNLLKKEFKTGLHSLEININ
ncbi:BolA/IbaG family iron-sulfur metabolism protein [Pelagibacteraceae bacterium]|nr:BolA/IbaG family iron-sulfur metabolism protein [Pelagibacteraceae bacterium]